MGAAITKAPFDDLGDRLDSGAGVTVASGDDTVALFKVDGVIHALEASCLRCGTCLDKGVVKGIVISCAGCDWRYDAITGSVEGVSALRLHVFDVETVWATSETTRQT